MTRTVRFPASVQGARDVETLTGALELKSAPQFVHPGESVQVHLETQLSPVPVIVPKERVEAGPPLPPPQPMGQFRLHWSLSGLTDAEASALSAGTSATEGNLESTPADSGRRKIRIPLEAAKLEDAAKTGRVRLELELSVGGLRVERYAIRLLHAHAPWPGQVRALLDRLEFLPEGKAAAKDAQPPPPAGSAEAAGEAERMLLIVPREDEADYRRFRPLGLAGRASPEAQEILFVGDPLVEAPAGTPTDALMGLAARLAKAQPERTWQVVTLPGPHRGWFMFRLLAETEAFLKRRKAGPAPATAVLALGGADAARQTPMHDFERGLDVVVDRLRRAGVQKLVVLGVLPEPAREKQAEPYHTRWTEVLRQHHLTGVDLFSRWTAEPGWERRYALDLEKSPGAYGPVPNAGALDEIEDLVRKALR